MSNEESLSETVQDYLKAIYEISQTETSPSTNQIADRLKVAPASVTGMLKRLSTMKPPLVRYQKHHGVQLTDEGLQISLQVIRKHRLIELFLVKILAYSWDEVHEEAERLEHAVSFRFVERLAHLLENPNFDPHGDPIPDQDLQLPTMQTIPLIEARQGDPFIIRRVQSSDPALLRYLGDMGIRPGAEVTVTNRVPFDRTIRVRVGACPVEQVLGPEISQLLQVEAQ